MLVAVWQQKHEKRIVTKTAGLSIGEIEAL